MRKKIIAAGFGLALALGGAATAVVAQQARPDMGGRHGWMADSTHRHHGDRMERALFKNIKLTDAQKAKLDSLHRSMMDGMRGQHEQMKAQFDQARAAQEKGDTATAKAIMDKLHTQMLAQHDAHMATVRTILTADQQKQFDANVADMKAKMAQWQKDHPGEMMGPGMHGRHHGDDDHMGPPKP